MSTLETQAATKISITRATIKSLAFKDGQLVGSFAVDADNVSATIADIKAAGATNFKADIAITGVVEQMEGEWMGPLPRVITIAQCSACGGRHPDVELKLHEGKDAYFCPERAVPVWDLRTQEQPPLDQYLDKKIKGEGEDESGPGDEEEEPPSS